MTLTSGTKLGPYEILAPLGAGGMGEVYRARDSRLGREVAIKVLPQHLSSNSEVRARFEREARTVSGLNHPHICVLHDVGREGDTDYLVMELVEGETLAHRLTKGPMPTSEVLRVGSQIADALDRAHRAGVTHRDLKPANVMLTRAGAKLMDFGLARATGLASGVTASSLTQSPTVAEPLTAEGTLVGTFQYMSPEQLEGREADARSDVWGLGCVLYEMATGKRAFEGKSQASLISAIMSSDPAPMTKVSPMVSPSLDRVVSQCLAKDPEDRFQSAHDVRLVLDSMRDATSPPTGVAERPPRRRRVPVWLVFAAGLVAGVGAGYAAFKTATTQQKVGPPRVQMITNSGSDQGPAPSPDGKTIAFSSARSGVPRIWIKQLASGDEVALTDGDDFNARYSPDGSQLLFVRSGKTLDLWRVSSLGGMPRRLVEDAYEGAWSRDGKSLAFLRVNGKDLRGEVWVADANGGNPRLAYSMSDAMQWLDWSPDSQRLITAVLPLANAPTRFVVVSVPGGEAQIIDPKAGLTRTSNPAWIGNGDRIVYAIGDALQTVVMGQSSRIVEYSFRTGEVRDLLSLPSMCRELAVLGDGRLVMGFGQQSQNLVLVDDAGTPRAKERYLTRGAGSDRQPVFSSDGHHVLFSSSRSGNLDLWELEIETGALTRLTDDDAQDWDPAYSPDGRSILWSSDRRSGVFEIWMSNRDGSSARQVSADSIDAENPTMTPDGEWIIFLSGKPGAAGVWKMRADGSEARLLVPNVNLPDVSSDGRYFAGPIFGGSALTTGLSIYRVNDGARASWTLPLPPRRSDIASGRSRWIGSDRLAYVTLDERGRYGIRVCDVSEVAIGPARDLAGFDPLAPTESFGVTPDGRRVVLSVMNSVLSIATAENFPGIEAPRSR